MQPCSVATPSFLLRHLSKDRITSEDYIQASHVQNKCPTLQHMMLFAHFIFIWGKVPSRQYSGYPELFSFILGPLIALDEVLLCPFNLDGPGGGVLVHTPAVFKTILGCFKSRFFIFWGAHRQVDSHEGRWFWGTTCGCLTNRAETMRRPGLGVPLPF